SFYQHTLPTLYPSVFRYPAHGDAANFRRSLRPEVTVRGSVYKYQILLSRLSTTASGDSHHRHRDRPSCHRYAHHCWTRLLPGKGGCLPATTLPVFADAI